MSADTVNPHWLFNQMLKWLYLWITLSTGWLTWYQYQIGQYQAAMDFSLLCTFASLVFCTTYLLDKYGLAKYLGAALMTAMLVIWQIHFDGKSSVMLHWALSLCVICFFIFPVKISLTIFLGIFAMISTTLKHYLPHQSWLEYSLLMILTGASSWSFGLLMHLKLKALKERALVDLESGAYNKHYLNQQLFEEVSRNKYTFAPVSMIGISIDDIHQIEDSHGKLVLQKLFRTFSEYIRNAIRNGDELFHIGEGTFFILLANSHAAGASILKERLDNGIESYRWPSVEEISIKSVQSSLEEMESADHFYTRILQTLNKKKETNLRIASFQG